MCLPTTPPLLLMPKLDRAHALLLDRLRGLVVLVTWVVGTVGGGPASSVHGRCGGATVLPFLGVGATTWSSDTLLGLGCLSGPTRILAGLWVPLNAWNSGAMCSSLWTFTMASPLELVELVSLE